MDFDIKKILPVIGAIATGNVPMLVGAAASAIGDVLGKPVEANAEAISAAVAGATPEQMAALRKVDNDFKAQMRSLDIEEQRVYVNDVADARKENAHNELVIGTAIFINVAGYICITLILVGCFQVFVNATKINIDPGIAALVGSVVGAAVQWILSNSNQANGFLFGSSPSARQVSADLGKAVGKAVGGGK